MSLSIEKRNIALAMVAAREARIVAGQPETCTEYLIAFELMDPGITRRPNDCSRRCDDCGLRTRGPVQL